MNDYQFGNFLRELRQKRGLSQYQLGRLVGVSNKAVSKWETGAAKPQTGICFKLAAALNVTVDELLACKFQEGKKARKGNLAMHQELWNQAKTQMYRMYGEHPPVEILGRFESEAAAFERTDVIVYLSFLKTLQQEARNRQTIIDIRGEWGSSFVAWLMGATLCNPLPPHYYCPNCCAVEFHTDVRDGWDLPRKNCACGHVMRRDGHQINVEHFAQMCKEGISLEIHIPDSFFPYIHTHLHTHFADTLRIYQIKMLDWGDWKDFRYKRYLLLPDTPNAPQSEDGTLSITSEGFWERYRNETNILFVGNPTYEILHRLEQQTNWQPYQVDFLNAEVFQQLRTCQFPVWLKDRLDNTMEIYRQSGQNCFSDLLTASGLTHSTGVWDGNGARLLKDGTASMDQLIAFREDVFHTILSHMPAGTGIGLPRKLMDETTKGRIHRNGMDEADEIALQSIGVPQWYIDSMKKILYLFPKSHSIQFEQVNLIAIWYDIHYPELCRQL